MKNIRILSYSIISEIFDHFWDFLQFASEIPSEIRRSLRSLFSTVVFFCFWCQNHAFHWLFALIIHQYHGKDTGELCVKKEFPSENWRSLRRIGVPFGTSEILKKTLKSLKNTFSFNLHWIACISTNIDQFGSFWCISLHFGPSQLWSRDSEFLPAIRTLHGVPWGEVVDGARRRSVHFP